MSVKLIKKDGSEMRCIRSPQLTTKSSIGHRT